MDDVLVKLRVPRSRLHPDETGNLVVGQERKGKGIKTYLFTERIAVSDLSCCWPWLASTIKFGYGRMRSQKDGRSKLLLAHRAVFSLVFGGIPSGLEIRHKCDNPICCNPFHLEPGTHKENMEDMSRRGRVVNNTPRKLSAAQIMEIRSMLSNGDRKAMIARQFGVSWSLIQWIAIGKHWSSAL